MLILTGKQKRYLRSQANTQKAVFSVGKNGVSKTWITEVLDTMRDKEVVKISVQSSVADNIDEYIEFIHANSQITVVQKIGKTLILYLPSKDEKYQTVSSEVNKLA
ncbi:MAG: YhbY family RNA-binding protein [Lactobacillaceae bacterium]|jgi:putative YhbY family RNA-binding protein|nr:YhbY family RNA-binding protein [Lactobacillaceae bacterium]